MAKAQSIVKLDLESNAYERKLRQAEKQWNQFTRGIGLSMSKFTAVGAAIGAVTGALKLAKDAFMANEQSLDEWGRTVQSAEALYKGFLQSLNGGSVDGFLARMNDIVTAARDAYNAMDELATFNAFNQINTSKTRAELMESIAGYREGKVSKEQVSAAAEFYKAELKARQQMEEEAYSKAVGNIAAQRGVSEKDLRAALSGTYGNYQQLKELPLSGTGTRSYASGFGMTWTQQVAAPANEMEKLGQALRALNDTELQSLQALGAQAWNTGYQVSQVDRMVQRYAAGVIKQPGGGGGTATPSGSSGPSGPFNVAGGMSGLAYQADDLLESMKKINANQIKVAPPEVLSYLETMDAYAERYRETMSKASSPEQYAQMVQNLEGITSNIENFKGAGKDIKNSWAAVASSISMVGSALQGLEDPAVKIFGIIAEAVANVALTFAKSLKGTVHPWEWIAAAAAGTATMMSTIAAIKQATAGYYAEGGIVPGNNYNDGLLAHVSSGEIILNRAQQDTLAGQLLGNRGPVVAAQPFVTGDRVFLGINNSLKSRGQGELVTTSMLRRMGIATG